MVQLRDFWTNRMAASEEAREIGEMTAEEAAHAMTVEDAPESTRMVVEITKSSCMLRPKKDKHPMILVCMSPRNPLRTKLTMEEKGKAVNLETNKEEEDLEDILIEENEDEDMENETEGTNLITRLPTYVPPWKGKAKVPKDIDESKISLQTLLLPDEIIFEGAHLGQVPSLKFED